jgi:hypothetical protein
LRLAAKPLLTMPGQVAITIGIAGMFLRTSSSLRQRCGHYKVKVHLGEFRIQTSFGADLYDQIFGVAVNHDTS